MPTHKLSTVAKQDFWNCLSLHLGFHPRAAGERLQQLQQAKDRLRHMFQATSCPAAPTLAGNEAPTNHCSGASSVHSSCNNSLTSSPTSAAEMMAMEQEWNSEHTHHKGAMDLSDDEVNFRYSPSPPTSHQRHSKQYNQQSQHSYLGSRVPVVSSDSLANTSSHHSNNIFLSRGSGSPASRARMACSPIVAGIQ